MKGNEVIKQNLKQSEKDKYIPVACRLCGEIVLFPKEFYKPKELIGYECANCRNMKRFFGW